MFTLPIPCSRGLAAWPRSRFMSTITSAPPTFYSAPGSRSLAKAIFRARIRVPFIAVDNRFLTETAAMRTLTSSSPRGDHTFNIGLALVGLFAALELCLLSYHYIGRAGARQTAAAPTTATTTQPAEARPPAAATAPAVAMVPAPTVAPAPAEAPAAPAPSAPAAPAEDPLVKEAIEWNNRGDTAIALNRLQQAAENNPKNAQAYAEMAKIYDSTGNLDRANEMWRKVHDLGASSGAVYELA